MYQPKEIPEEVNVTKVNPLVNLGYLLGTVAVFGTAVYLSLGAVATQLAVKMSPEMEHKIGLEMLENSNFADEEDLSARQIKQQDYLQQLLVSLNGGTTSRDIPLKVYLWEQAQPNAFVFPGGQIVVTTGLVEAAESENEIAFVLAHELAHHVERDGLKGMGRSLVLLFVSTAIGIGSGNGDFVISAANLGDLHYSREQEALADRYALAAVVDYYGHGSASLDFFQKILDKKRDRRSKMDSYFSTHPLTEARINDLNKMAAEKGWLMEGELTELPSIF